VRLRDVLTYLLTISAPVSIGWKRLLMLLFVSDQDCFCGSLL